MSYRTYVNNFQIFGNNEGYEEWIEFIKSQGVKVSKDGCYDGYITDVMGALKVIEDIVISKEDDRRKAIAECKDPENDYCPKSIFEFGYIYDKIKKFPEDFFLFDQLKSVMDDSYIFMPIAFIKACGDDIERAHHEESSYRYFNYKVKEGCKIHVRAR